MLTGTSLCAVHQAKRDQIRERIQRRASTTSSELPGANGECPRPTCWLRLQDLICQVPPKVTNNYNDVDGLPQYSYHWFRITQEKLISAWNHDKQPSQILKSDFHFLDSFELYEILTKMSTVSQFYILTIWYKMT